MIKKEDIFIGGISLLVIAVVIMGVVAFSNVVDNQKKKSNKDNKNI